MLEGAVVIGIMLWHVLMESTSHVWVVAFGWSTGSGFRRHPRDEISTEQISGITWTEVLREE